MKTIRSVIRASGSFLPPIRMPNEAFLDRDFRSADGTPFTKTNQEILDQFEGITGIHERRYAPDDMVTSDLAAAAAKRALDSAELDAETLDAIIVAHNFGDVRSETRRSDLVPALAARVKHDLGIRNPASAAWDLIFGCPGWLQGVIVADTMIRARDAKSVMVIGAEALSRVSDPHDRDSLIYSDGAGATVLEAVETEEEVGILAHTVRSDTNEELEMLSMARSYNPELLGDEIYLKMEGRKLYRYALQTVAGSIRACLERAGIAIGDVAKILLHQANYKMDEAIISALYHLYDLPVPAGIMPMTIGWLGNSSVATLPTMYDLIVNDKLDGHRIASGDNIVFASVGAGMNINAVVYRVP